MFAAILLPGASLTALAVLLVRQLAPGLSGAERLVDTLLRDRGRQGTPSPTALAAARDGMRLAWKFESLVTGQKSEMDPPNRLDPGPLAARIAAITLFVLMQITARVDGTAMFRRENVRDNHRLDCGISGAAWTVHAAVVL